MKDVERGQVLLIVVLIMVTALTIGLSVAARTITNIRTSQEAEHSERAFSAAEAGIEESLTSNRSETGTFTNNTSYTTVMRTVSGLEFPLNNAAPVLKDDAHDLWLSTYPNYTNPWSGTLTLYWGKTNNICTNSELTNTTAALEVIVLSGSVSNPVMTRYALDPCSQRSLQNRFEFVSPGGGTINGQPYAFRRAITVTSGLFIRIIPLYSSANIAARGCNLANTSCLNLPSQGTVVEATGISDATQRKIISYKLYPKLPIELFPYSFFAPQ